MNRARLDMALGILVLSLAAVSLQRTQTAVSSSRIPEPVLARAAAVPPSRNTDSLADYAAMIIDNDVFRLSNQPSPVPFLLAPPPAVERRGPVRPPRPALVLRAIMGGPPWIAVIDGLPGQTGGVTVRSGDSFEKLVVRAVGRDTVVVQAPDTTWKLTLSRQP